MKVLTKREIEKLKAHCNKLHNVRCSIELSGVEFRKARKHHNMEKISHWRENLKKHALKFKELIELEIEERLIKLNKNTK
jgi:hypothetical protein